MTRELVDDCFRPSERRLRHAEAVELLKAACAKLTIARQAGTEAVPAHSIPDQAIASDRTGVEHVPLADAAGRILAADVAALAPVPAHTNAAVDGYAFRATPALRATGGRLPIAARAAAGHPVADPVAEGMAARIFTGAVMPDGVDTVVMQEDVETDGATVAIPPGLKPGANVRKAGEDVAAGAHLYTAGQVLRPQDLAALASIGCAAVPCRPRLRVAIVSTGDEVIEAGAAPLTPGQVYDANAPMLSALAALAGAEVTRLGIWRDRLDGVTAGLRDAAARFDVILTSGGASLGEEDHMAKALAAIGHRHMWQIAVKPGRPMMFGQIRSGDHDCIVVGLPGNPVAVFVCFLMYVFPLLRALGGAPWPEPRRLPLPAAFEFPGRKAGRREFWRGRMAGAGAELAVEKFARDGSGLITGLRWSDGLIDIPEETGDIARGDAVAFIPYAEFGIV